MGSEMCIRDRFDVVLVNADADITLVAQTLGQHPRVMFAKVLSVSAVNSE